MHKPECTNGSTISLRWAPIPGTWDSTRQGPLVGVECDICGHLPHTGGPCDSCRLDARIEILERVAGLPVPTPWDRL